MNILLLRGLGRNQQHWGSFPETLEKLNPNIKTFCIDLPGFGDFDQVQAPLSVSGNTKFVRTHWRSYSASMNEDWTIVGISMGGMVALDWLNRYQDDFKKAILINTSSRSVGKPWHRLKPQSLYHFKNIALAENSRNREASVWPLIANNPRNEDIIGDWARIQNESPSHPQQVVKQLFASALFKHPKKLSQSLLFLNSLGDNMVDYRCSEKLADHYKAQLETHPSAGHDLPLDEPHWVIEKINTFIN